MNFSDFSNIVFANSTKDFGNMAFKFGRFKDVYKNRENFLNKLGLTLKDIVLLDLEHENRVCEVSVKDLGASVRGDSVVTSFKQVYLGILTGDCLPIGMYDPITESIALIHVSVNNVEKVIGETINSLKTLGTESKSLIVEIGPSIGPCHHRRDLWQTARDRLLEYGIENTNITNHKICTYENNFFSHRRSDEKKDTEGRLITVLGIK